MPKMLRQEVREAAAEQAVAGCSGVSVWQRYLSCAAMCCTAPASPGSSAELGWVLQGLQDWVQRVKEELLAAFWHSHSGHSWSVTDTSFKSRLQAWVLKVWTGIMQQLHLVWDCKQICSVRERQTVLSLVKQHFMAVRVSSEYDLGWIVLFQERSV